jgi:hypothetical protein
LSPSLVLRPYRSSSRISSLRLRSISTFRHSISLSPICAPTTSQIYALSSIRAFSLVNVSIFALCNISDL